MTRGSGIVKFFREKNGYGFIAPDDGGSDIFVHRKDLEESCRVGNVLMLAEDQVVSFAIVDTDKGRKGVAVHVERRQAATEDQH